MRKRRIPQPRISWGSWAEYPNVSGSQNWEHSGQEHRERDTQQSAQPHQGWREKVGREGVMEKNKYLRAEPAKVLLEEPLSLEELPHHGLPAGQVPILGEGTAVHEESQARDIL